MGQLEKIKEGPMGNPIFGSLDREKCRREPASSDDSI